MHFVPGERGGWRLHKAHGCAAPLADGASPFRLRVPLRKALTAKALQRPAPPGALAARS